MALIGKIRKNFWLVLIVLGLALASFVIMDMVSAGNQGGTTQLTMGEVAGSKIDYRQFQKIENALYSGSTDTYGRRNSLWNYLIEKAIIDKQAEGLGLDVSRDELMDLQFGNNLSPVIQNNFRNPQTGQVDRQQLLQFRTAIENGEELNPSFRSFWAEQEKQIIKTEIQDKLNTMVSKGIYTPTWLAESINTLDNEKVDFEYVKIGFDDIDETVEVSDDDVKAYVSKNETAYVSDEETRVVRYAAFDVLPTSRDSVIWENELTGILDEFKRTDDDSLFVVNRNGFYSTAYVKAEDLSEALREPVLTMDVDSVFGPFEEGGSYLGAKLIDKQIIPDSARASHILRSAEPTDIAGMLNARLYIDSLRSILERGGASFDSLAIKNSQDPGSGSQGGDLGTFAPGRMVPEFNDAVFIGSEEGGLYTVQTQFGVHLIRVDELIYENNDPKYKLAYVITPIIPTQGTQDSIYSIVYDLITENPDLASLEQSVASQHEGIQVERANAVKENDYIFANLGSGQNSRDIVKWAFDSNTEVNDISPTVYIVSDKVNYFNSQYVITALEGVYKKGEYDINTVRSQAENAIINEKKGEIFASKITSRDLNEIATQYNTTVETASGVSFTATSVPNIGNEQKVIASAFALSEGSVSDPIVGNSGVYIIKPTAKTASDVTANIPSVRRTANSQARNQVNFSLINALKKKYKVSDNRSIFY